MGASGATTSLDARPLACRCGGSARDRGREPTSASSTGSARPTGDTLWLRDLVHVVHGRQGTRQIRGLIIDITERKQAEQALRESERKYSEAFRREREAAQQLRALDEMKNTFLEAVSHDLRTPLTSILGSALTLEQSRLQLPPADALDLVDRIAANARKLERLLADLLDLDRLQRGIVTPQRRPTDVAALIARVVAEIENPDARMIDIEVGALTVPDRRREGGADRREPDRRTRSGTPRPTRTIWVRAHRAGRRVVLGRRRRRARGSPRGSARRSSSRSSRRRARRPSTRRASASDCHSCDASPSCTAAAPGSSRARAAARRSACSCPTAEPEARQPPRARC